MTARFYIRIHKDSVWGFDAEAIEDAKQAAIQELKWYWINDRVAIVDDVVYRAGEIRGVVLSEEQVNNLKRAHQGFSVWVQGIGDIE